ncbi:hypothetical protein ACA910_020068 [Epithemia clementina (nom. ined.)]
MSSHSSDDEENMHSLPVPEEVKTESIISSMRRQEEEDSRAAFKKTRRRSLILSGVALVAFVAVVGFMVAFFTKGERHSKTQAYLLDEGRQNDVTKPAWDQVVTLLQTYSPIDTLQKVGSPQNLAANWMAQQVGNNTVTVPAGHDYENAFEFVQRYALATFYYALDGRGWKYNLGFMNVSKSVCDWNQNLNVVPGTFVMVHAQEGKQQTFGYQGDFSTKIDATIGIKCNDAGEVNYVFIPDNNLKGQLPPEVGLLEAMQHFSVYLNSISGFLPESLREWSDLEVLIVENNLLEGPFPSYIDQWPKLLTISLANNQFYGNLPSFELQTTLRSVALNDNKFTGPINVFNKNTQLQVLFLQDNNFTGEITPDLLVDVDLQIMDCSNNKITGQITSDWYSLTILDVHNNLMSGSLPEVGEDRAIAYFSAYGNSMSGQIPDSLGNLYALYHLDLSNNTFTGIIPDTFTDLENLQYLYLGDNNFDEQEFPNLYDCTALEELSLRSCNLTSDLPHFVGKNLVDMVMLDVSNNKLQGPIPANIAYATGIRFLLLAGNNFTGYVPTSFADLDNLNVLTVDHNPHLNGTMGAICTDGPAKLQHVLTDCPVECSCCDTCCGAGGNTAATCGSETLTPNLNGDGTYQRTSYIFNEELVFSNDNTPDGGST